MKSILTILILVTACTFAKGQPDTSQLNVYYGLMHAHTMICDGDGTPEEAYRMARKKGLSFFAVTAHNHAAAENSSKNKDGVLIATNPDLYNGKNDVSVVRRLIKNKVEYTQNVKLKPLMQAARQTTRPDFLALYGQEFSTISSGNHMNVFGFDQVLAVPDGDFKTLLKEAKDVYQKTGAKPVFQLNHPDVYKDLFYRGAKSSELKKKFNDYGIDKDDFGPHFSDLNKEIGPFTHLIEVLTGPALSEVYKPYHALENEYFFYLKQGFHLSPSAGQDNHYKTWGGITDARIGVLSSELTQSAIFEAIRKNRTFVTEDKNLITTFTVNDSTMGSSINAVPESELTFNITISDKDEPDARYKIEVYGSTVSPELSTAATNWKADDGLLVKQNAAGNGNVVLKGIFASSAPSFYYVKVIQNPNEKTDRAWTSPVWINENKVAAQPLALLALTDTLSAPVAQFYWTASSQSAVYHLKGCRSVDLIKPANLRFGNEAPAGRTLHNCIIIEEEDEVEH